MTTKPTSCNDLGGVASISGIKHPIEAARLVMDNSSHVLIVGEGAYNFTTR